MEDKPINLGTVRSKKRNQRDSSICYKEIVVAGLDHIEGWRRSRWDLVFTMGEDVGVG